MFCMFSATNYIFPSIILNIYRLHHNSLHWYFPTCSHRHTQAHTFDTIPSVFSAQVVENLKMSPLCFWQNSKVVSHVLCEKVSSLSYGLMVGCGLCRYVCLSLPLTAQSKRTCSFFLSVSGRRKCEKGLHWQGVWIVCVCVHMCMWKRCEIRDITWSFLHFVHFWKFSDHTVF